MSSVQSPIFFPFPKVKKFGNPTWERLVEAVEDGAGGNSSALAKTIASDHPGEPGNLIHQFAIIEDLVICTLCFV